MRLSSTFAIAILVCLEGCAAVNPNPNTGMRTTDRAYNRGDCDGARKIAEPAALRGEPWAQYRMGALLIDEKCPNKSPKNVGTAIGWLAKAACYESKSAWERGNELAVGPLGYFNARASATKAALMLDEIFINLQRAGGAWAFVDRARSQYSPDESTYRDLSKRLVEIEALIGSESVAKLKNDKTICSTAK